MANILTNVSITDLLSNTTNVLSAISPFLVLLVGVLLAFLIITEIIKLTSNYK